MFGLESAKLLSAHLVDALVPVILVELFDLTVRERQPSRDVFPAVADVRLDGDHVVERELFDARAQLLHVLRHRPVLRLRPGSLGLRRRVIVRRIMIHVAYVTRPRADLHPVRVDDVVVDDVRALRCKSNFVDLERPIDLTKRRYLSS